MAAVVAGSVSIRRDHPAQARIGGITRRSTKKPRLVGRTRGVFKLMLSILVIAVAFGYVNLHASLTSTSYSRNELMSQCRLEKIRNQRLRVELMRLMSPQYVLAGAEKANMVPASDYDYLNKSETIAKAGGRRAE